MRKFLFSLATLLGTLVPLQALAFSITDDWTTLCGDILPCNGSATGAAGLSVYVFAKIVTAFEIGLIAAAILILLISSANLVIYSTEENTVKESRLSFVYVITGCAIVGLAHLVVRAFSPNETGELLVNHSFVNETIGNVLLYFRLILSIALTANIVIQAVRLISSQGQEEQVGKAHKRLIAGFVGVGFVLLANAVLVAVRPEFGSSSELAVQIVGLANYLITILAFLAVAAIIVAGLLLLISVDEGLRDKAKTAVKTAVIALIVILVSYALVNAFIGNADSPDYLPQNLGV